MKLKYVTIILVIVLLTGCQMARSVKRQGNGLYSVSSVSCPACGGTINSEKLALDEANEFCSREDKSAITESIRSAPYNNLGGGRTELIFKCEDPVTVNENAACLNEVIEIIEKEFGQTMASIISEKIVVNEDGFGFDNLSDETYPSNDEKRAINKYGSGYDNCFSKVIAVSSQNDKRFFIETTQSFLAALANLSAGKISYGEYAKEANEITSRIIKSESINEHEATLRRPSENEQR